MSCLSNFKDDIGRIKINCVPIELLSNIHGIGEQTLKKLITIKGLGLPFSVDILMRMLPSSYFSKDKIIELFNFETDEFQESVDHSQSEPCVTGERSQFINSSKSLTTTTPLLHHEVDMTIGKFYKKTGRTGIVNDGAGPSCRENVVSDASVSGAGSFPMATNSLQNSHIFGLMNSRSDERSSQVPLFTHSHEMRKQLNTNNAGSFGEARGSHMTFQDSTGQCPIISSGETRSVTRGPQPLIQRSPIEVSNVGQWPVTHSVPFQAPVSYPSLPVPHYPRSETPRSVIPNKFEQKFMGDPGEAWDVFLYSFRSFLHLANIETFELAMHYLRNALRGKALGHLMTLESLHIVDLETIFKKMEERFGHSMDMRRQLAQIEIESLFQSPQESAECWAARVLDTYRKAFPEVDSGTLERLSVNKFCLGLDDSAASLLLTSQDHKTMSDALYALSRIKNHKLATAHRSQPGQPKPRARLLSCNEESGSAENLSCRATNISSQDWRPAVERLEKKLDAEIVEIKEMLTKIHRETTKEFSNGRGRSVSPYPRSAGSRSRTPTPARGISANSCHRCGQHGHWAKECPSKSPRVSFKEDALKGDESTK